MDHGQLYLILAVIFAFFMAWGVGANDVANAMGTSVGSKAITLNQAILIAAVFEAAGALLAGGQVTDTIRSKIIDAALFTNSPNVLIDGMLASLLAAGSWLLIATRFGWPVSTTHSIIGAVIGFALVVLGTHAIYWGQVVDISLSWIITPVIACAVAYLLFRSVQYLIFHRKDPIRKARIFVPWYIFLVTMVLSSVTLLSGFKHLGFHLTMWEGTGVSVAISLLAMVIGAFALRRIQDASDGSTRHQQYQVLEKFFGILMIFTACAMAFAHGSNDVANSIGPLAAIVGIVKSGGSVLAHSPIPVWILALGAVGIVLGLATYGYRVIATIGSEITQLTPSRGFAAQLATASTVVLASGMGLPVSTTQTMVGAVLGVGFARGMSAINLSVVRNIFMSWIITLPAGAVLSIIYYHLIRLIFGI